MVAFFLLLSSFLGTAAAGISVDRVGSSPLACFDSMADSTAFTASVASLVTAATSALTASTVLGGIGDTSLW